MAEKELAILLTAKNMASGAINKVRGDVSKLDKVSGHASRGMKNLAANVTAIGITAGVAAAGLIAKSVMAASDLNETISKSSVVFREASGEVLAWSKSSAAAIGLSQNAALGAAATYGNLFVSMGLATDKSADMSMKLVQLAGDLASFNNIDPTEAAEKLRAGLTGESEPLKSLGININETIIKAKALELGLVKTSASTADLKLKTVAMNKAQKEAAAAVKQYGVNSTQALKATVKAEKAQEALEKATNKIPGTLDAATKAQAAYALIFEQSTTAQGDFARTSDGLANQQRILKANLENTAATLGGALLPKVAELAKRINELVMAKQPEIAAFAGKLPAIFDRLIALVMNLPWGSIESAFKLMGTGAEAALTLFTSMPPWVQTAVLTGWGLNKLTGGAVGGIVSELGKGLIRGVLGMNAGVVNINAGVVNGGGKGGIPPIAGVGGGAAAAGGMGLMAGTAALAAGVAVSALAIMGLGELINATSTPQQKAAREANIREANRRRYGANNVPAAPARAMVGTGAADAFRGLQDQRRGERGGAIHTAIEQEKAAVQRLEASTAPSMKSAESHLAQLKSLQAGQAGRDATYNAQLISAIGRLERVVGQGAVVNVYNSAADNIRTQIRRRRVVKPTGSRGALVGEFG